MHQREADTDNHKMDKSVVLSLLVAICALVLTLYQIHATRKHNKLSVRPHIRFGWNAGTTGDGIWIKNDGMGTAIVEKFEISKDGEIINLKQLEDELSNRGLETRVQIISENSTIQDKDVKWLIRTKEILEFGDEQEVFWEVLSGLEIKLTYMSFYNVSEKPIHWVVPNPIENHVRAKPSRESNIVVNKNA